MKEQNQDLQSINRDAIQKPVVFDKIDDETFKGMGFNPKWRENAAIGTAALLKHVENKKNRIP